MFTVSCKNLEWARSELMLYKIKFQGIKTAPADPLPLSYETNFPKAPLPSFETLKQIQTQDQFGNRRLQIYIYAAPQAKSTHVFAHIVQQNKRFFEIIWMVRLPTRQLPDPLFYTPDQSPWISRGEWMSNQVPPHQKKSVTRQDELYQGIIVEYKKDV